MRPSVLLAVLTALTPGLRAAIEIGYADLKQTIDGFGGNVAIDNTPYYTDLRDGNTSNLALTDAQMTALSQVLFTNSGDNLNIGLLRVSNFFDYKINSSDSAYATRPVPTQNGINYVNYLRGTRRVMKDFRTLRAGLPPAEQGTIIMTAWSPPPYLKSNGSAVGGTLRNHPSTGQIDYAGLADWWKRSLDHYATPSNGSIVPDILSIQNEPDFTSANWEGSRLYATASTAPVYKDAFAAVRNRLLANYGGLQYMAPDTSALAPNASRVLPYLSTLPAGQVDVIAHHLYDTTDTSGAAKATASLSAGKIGSVTISDGGGGYETVPSVTFAAPPTGGIRATGNAVIANGRVTSISITNAGAGYTTAPVVTIAEPTTTAKLNQIALENAYPHTTYTKYQTEYTGDRNQPWGNYIDIIHNTLVHERANSYLVWDLIWGCVDPKTLFKTKCYYALAHYSKFVPIGSTRVPASAKNTNGSGDGDIQVTAYRKARGWIGGNRLEDQLVLVIYNRNETSSKTHTIKLSDSVNGSYWDDIVTERFLKVIRTRPGGVRLDWEVNKRGSSADPLGGDYTLTLAPKEIVTFILN